ncbi:hypothetical protein Dimus_012998 [Dionaea muscipula]
MNEEAPAGSFVQRVERRSCNLQPPRIHVARSSLKHSSGQQQDMWATTHARGLLWRRQSRPYVGNPVFGRLSYSALATVSSPSIQSSPESPPLSNHVRNDPSSSDESNDGSDDDSDGSESEDDSDDSSSDPSPLHPQPREHIHAPLSEGENSSFSNLLYPSSITDPDAEPFVHVEDPADSDVYVEIMVAGQGRQVDASEHGHRADASGQGRRENTSGQGHRADESWQIRPGTGVG